MSWTIRPNDNRLDYQQFDEPITQYNDIRYSNNSNLYGIPLRDRLTDAFAYFPAEQYEYTGYIDNDRGDPDPGSERFDELDDDSKKTQRIANSILREMQKHNMDSAEAQFIYSELLDSQALIAINRLKNDIAQPWTVMKIKHIDLIEARHGCKLVTIKTNLSKTDMIVKRRIERRLQRMYDMERGRNSAVCNLRTAHPLTTYADYLKRIQDHRIEIPDRFDIAAVEPYCMGRSYLPMKMMARYYRRDRRNRPIDVSNLIDLTGIMLLDLHSIRSKTMFCLHICMPNRREGITVIDQPSYSLNAVIHSPHLSQYLIYYGTTTNYSVYTLFNSTEATILHLTYAMLEPDLKRMVFYSPRHVLKAIELLGTRTDMVKGLLLKAANITEDELLEFTHESEDGDDESKSEKSKSSKSRHGRSYSMSKAELLERISHVYDVLYCIKKGFNTNRNIISECISDLWPKLDMIGCEIRGEDYLLLRHLQNILSVQHKGITIYSPIYGVSEAVIGYNIDCHPDNRYTLDPSQAYFEFLEVDDSYFRNDKVDLKARSMRKLKDSHLYEVVVSSDHTDTIRQMTGEIVRICGKNSGVPIVRPICREIELIYSYSYVSEDDDELISQIITPQDIDQIFVQSKLDVQEYCYRKVQTIYKIYIELHRFDYDEIDDEESDYQRTVYDVTKDAKDTRTLYRLKRLLIPGYDSKSRPIKPNITDVEVRIVEPGTFDRIIQMRGINSIDPNTIRVSRRVVDEYEINTLKSAIVHQLQ